MSSFVETNVSFLGQRPSNAAIVANTAIAGIAGIAGIAANVENVAYELGC